MKHFDITELKALLVNIPKSRYRLGVLVAFWHGLRASEVTSLKGRDFRHGHIDIKRLKGSLRTIQRYQKHPDPELDEYGPLSALEGTIDPDEKFLPISRSQLWRIIQKAGKQAGINPLKLHPHTLKHSIAMLTIPAGIEVTRQRCGHKSIASTGEYLRVSDDYASDKIDSLIGAL